MAFDDDGSILAAQLDHVQDVGAYPTPWPVGTAAAVGMIFPGPVPDPGGQRAATTSMFSNTAGRTAYRGPVAVRDRRPGDAPRHRRPPDGPGPGRAAPAQLAAPRTTCRTRTPIGMPYDHMSPREMFEHALEMLDYDAFRRRAGGGPRAAAATSASARAATSSPRPPAMGSYGTRGRRRSASSRPARSTCTWPAARPATASRPPRCSSPPMRSASTSTTSTRSRATPRSPRSALGTGGSRSGSMIAGAVAATAADAA